MLDFLHIRGLALLDDVELDFGAGMNVLTGETGAGKSIIVDALGLVRGARGRAGLVREGEAQATVEAQFCLDDKARARVVGAMQSLGLELSDYRVDDESLLIGRSVKRAGRGRARLQSRLVTRAGLEGVGTQLVDICSQHEHHSLTDVASHLDLLDTYAGLRPKREAYVQTYRAWQACCMELRDVRAAASERVRRLDYLRFQIEELEGLGDDVGQAVELRERVVLLRDSHRWASFASEAHHLLYEADDAIGSKLARLAEQAARGPEACVSLVEMREQLENAAVACDEAARAAAALGDELSCEPGELDELSERVHELDRLERKHGCEAAELGAQLEEMQAEAATLEGADARVHALEAQDKELGAEASKRAKALHRARVKAAKQLGGAIELELHALHLPHARLQVSVSTGSELGPRGNDEVEFLFSANPGEPVAPLNKVASGGELSRVLLAVKGVLATGDPVVTYVFDEVDAGVGGAVAEAIGQRLSRTSTQRQVLCITHLPQIAAFAHAHFRVEKHCEAGRTVTRVRRLNEAQRVEELARMMAGARVTKTARQHAKDLLDQARAWQVQDAPKTNGRGAGAKAKPKAAGTKAKTLRKASVVRAAKRGARARASSVRRAG